MQELYLIIINTEEYKIKKASMKDKENKVTAAFRSKEMISFPNFYYHHHHYQKFVLGYFSIRFAFCTHRSSSVNDGKRDREMKRLPKILSYFSQYLWVINEISRIYEKHPRNQKCSAERLVTVALGLSVVFLNLKMSAFIKEGKSEYLRKKTTRRTGLREEPTKNSICFWDRVRNKNPNN